MQNLIGGPLNGCCLFIPDDWDSILVGGHTESDYIEHRYERGVDGFHFVGTGPLGANDACTSEKHSWDYFKPEQVDSYWMRCHRLGPHDEHENSETGAKWRDPARGSSET